MNRSKAPPAGSPRVIYITGTSFSGSTILGALLGQHPQCMCAGELSNWTTYRDSMEVACSCGLNWQECAFWRRTRELWLDESHPGWEAYISLQNRFERIRNIPTLKLQQAMSAFAGYAAATRRIYQILTELSHRQIIVDISKKVGRGQALAQMGGLDLSFIHLVREGRGYLASSIKHMRRRQQRGSQEPPLPILLTRSILEWIVTNRMAERMIATSGLPSLRIRYEDLIADPSCQVDRVARALSLDLDAVQVSLKSSQPVSFGHMWGGNEIRLQGPMHLIADETWKQAISPLMDQIFWVVAGSTSGHYGYARDGSVR